MCARRGPRGQGRGGRLSGGHGALAFCCSLETEARGRLPQRRGRARKCVSVASHGTAPAPRGAASSLHCAKGTWHACSERSPQPFFSVALPLPRSLDAPFTRTGQRMENFNFSRNLYPRARARPVALSQCGLQRGRRRRSLFVFNHHDGYYRGTQGARC